MSEQYQITVDDKTIQIKKLDTNEYEFTMDYQYLQYYGKSFLKDLQINKFQDYLKFYEQKEEIKIKEISNNFYLELPIPFTTNCEIITLKKPELTECAEFKILLKKQEDEFKMLLKLQQDNFNKQLEAQKKEFSEQNTILKKELDAQNNIFTKKLEKQETHLEVQYYELIKEFKPDKYYIIIHNNRFNFAFKDNYKFLNSFKDFIIRNINKIFDKDKISDSLIYNIKNCKSFKELDEFNATGYYSCFTFRLYFDYLKEMNYFINNITINKFTNTNYYDNDKTESLLTSISYYINNPYYTNNPIIIEFTTSKNKMKDYFINRVSQNNDEFIKTNMNSIKLDKYHIINYKFYNYCNGFSLGLYELYIEFN
jgi:hypothetical protein